MNLETFWKKPHFGDNVQKYPKNSIKVVFINYDFFLHKILCMQIHCKCMSVPVGNCAHKRADIHVISNMTQW